MNELDHRQTLFLVMGNLFHKARNYLDEQFKAFDLTRNEWLILALLRVHTQGLSQSFAKTYLGVEISYFTKILNKLENRGLIIREIDHADRRNRIIKPNPATKAELKKMHNLIAKLNQIALSDLSDKELKLMHQHLTSIEHKLDILS